MAQQKQLGDPLTRGEIRIIRLIAQGYRSQGIADQLGIAPSTVHKHIQNIMTVLGLRSRTQIAIHALKRGIICLEDIDLTSQSGRNVDEPCNLAMAEFNEFLERWCPAARRQLLRRIVYRLVYGRHLIETAENKAGEEDEGQQIFSLQQKAIEVNC